MCVSRSFDYPEECGVEYELDGDDCRGEGGGYYWKGVGDCDLVMGNRFKTDGIKLQIWDERSSTSGALKLK